MSSETAFDDGMRRQSRSRPVGRAIAAFAERQHGVIARCQLAALGLGSGAIDHRVRAGQLYVIHKGAYAVGHRALTRQGRWMAAALAAGSDAVLSHHAAAAHWGLRNDNRARIDITTPRKLHPRKNLLPHCAVLPPDEITTHDAIPTTTVPRTLLDLAAVLPRQAVQRAMTEADVQRLTDPLSLPDLIARHPRARGVTKLRDHLPILTREELEHRFQTFLDAAVLPRPHFNTHIEGYEVDVAWPARRLIAELDGYATHRTRRAFERDRQKDRHLLLAGWTVTRITWRQLHDHPARLAAELRALLER